MCIKRCWVCEQFLELNKFSVCNRNKDGHQASCKECDKKNNHKNHIKRIYGISISEYNDMFIMQASGCAICGRENVGGKRLSVDHCHETGRIRGLLCGKCNPGIGLFQDAPDLLLRSAQCIANEEDRAEQFVSM